MKIIEAMKEVKRLHVKLADLRTKVHTFCADSDFETPAYGSVDKQFDQIKEWVQAHMDTVQRIAELRIAIQRTNLQTMVTVEINGKPVKKSIAEWVLRRGNMKKGDGLAKQDMQLWNGIGDRGLREGIANTSTGGTKEVKIRRYFDPRQRDEMVALYTAEPSLIDAQLEVTNAVTDLVE